MAEYTPPTEVVKDAACFGFPRQRLGEPRGIDRAAFDRWLAARDSESRAEVAREVRDYWDACGDFIDSHNAARLAVEAIVALIETFNEKTPDQPDRSEEASRG